MKWGVDEVCVEGCDYGECFVEGQGCGWEYAVVYGGVVSESDCGRGEVVEGGYPSLLQQN